MQFFTILVDILVDIDDILIKKNRLDLTARIVGHVEG